MKATCFAICVIPRAWTSIGRRGRYTCLTMLCRGWNKALVPAHPNFIKSIALDALRGGVLGQFHCTVQPCNEVYTSVRNLVIHLLTTHFHFVMARPIRCGATFITLQTVQDHFEEAHTRSFPLIRDTSITDVDAMNDFLNSHTFTISETARRVHKALHTSPTTVFFIDVETTVSFMGHC